MPFARTDYQDPPALTGDAKNPPIARNLRERRIVWNLMQHLTRAGFIVYSVDNGGDKDEPCRADLALALDHVFSVDEARIYFESPGRGSLRGVFIVLGNDTECISDFSSPNDRSDRFAELVDEICDGAEAGTVW